MSIYTTNILVNWKRMFSVFHIWFTLSMIQPQFTVLVQYDTVQILSILHKVHFIIISHTQTVITTFVINLEGYTFNLKLKSQL